MKRNKVDIHAQSAALIYGKAAEDITCEERYIGKLANWPYLYGGGKPAVSTGRDVRSGELVYVGVSAFSLGYQAYMVAAEMHSNPFEAGTQASTQWALGYEYAGEVEADAAEVHWYAD